MSGLRAATHRRVLLSVAAVTALALVLTVRSQIYDSNFYVLWEATSILAGDRPYRDFYEWGAPLAVVFSTGMQLLVGYRLIGEFLLQWTFIVAGVVIAFHLGLRLSRSVPASLVMFVIALPMVAYTPTYHYSKLFFFPATIWLAWRYMDRPSPSRAAVFGLTTAVAFLFRHDYGLYIGCAAIAAWVLARAAVPASRRLNSVIADAVAYAGAVGAVVAPWIVIVHMNEGFVEYVGASAGMYEEPSAAVVYAELIKVNPIGPVVSWFREPGTASAAANGALWLKQLGLLMPILFFGPAGVGIWRRLRHGAGVPPEAWQMAVAGVFLAAVASSLFREPAYVVVTAPVTAALSARFLTGRGAAGRGIAAVLLILTAVAAVVWTRDSPLFHPSELRRSVTRAFAQLLASPPVPAESDGTPSPMLQYLRDCSVPGDRLLVTGSTPYQVNYYAQRPAAGGHVFWRQRRRSDPRREQQSLELLQRQSVPFAFSTTDAVLEDFKSYPRIREYLLEHYVELEGSKGRLLVDRRRQPTGTFGPLGFPCFR